MTSTLLPSSCREGPVRIFLRRFGEAWGFTIDLAVPKSRRKLRGHPSGLPETQINGWEPFEGRQDKGKYGSLDLGT